MSGNPRKVEEAQLLLDPELFPWRLEAVDLDIEEIQATQLEVAIHKCNTAKKLCGDRPVIVEDTSLAINALGGMPGVYIKDFWEALGNKGLITMIENFPDTSAYVQCTLCFARDSESPVKTFVGQTFGSLLPEERGAQGFGWDSLFLPVNMDKTFGEMTTSEKNMYSHRSKAFKQLQTYLNSRMGS